MARVLLIVDSSFLREALEHSIRSLGHEVLGVESPFEAARAAEAFVPHCAVGAAACASALDGVPVIALDAKGTNERVAAVLSRPVERDLLGDAITSVLATARAARRRTAVAA